MGGTPNIMILGIPHSKKHPYQDIPGTTSDEPLKFSGPSGWDDFSLTMCAVELDG